MPTAESFPGLHMWLETPLGGYVMDWEADRYDRVVADIFGYNAVQLGIPERDFLRANRMPFRCRAGVGEVHVQADYSALPFAANSLDLVVLPHVLEFAAQPHQVLREVERVLVADGQVVITGFNPYSLFGLRRLAAGECLGYPWHGQYLSQRRLKDWLTLLSFEMHRSDAGCYIPGVEQEKWIERLRLLDRAGRRWWPFMGGVYMVQAIKRVHGMRLIMPRWDRKAGARSLAPLVQKSTAPQAECSQQNRNDVYFGRD